MTKHLPPKDGFGCRKQEVSFKEKNKSKLIRLLFRLDGSNGNHIIFNVPVGVHFTYFFSFSIVLFLLTCGLSFTLSNLFISSWFHFTVISKIYRRKTREMTSAILAMGVSRQLAQRYTVYVMYTDILYVVHFVTSFAYERAETFFLTCFCFC